MAVDGYCRFHERRNSTMNVRNCRIYCCADALPTPVFTQAGSNPVVRRGERCHGAIVQGQDHRAGLVLRDSKVASLAGVNLGAGLPGAFLRRWIVGDARGLGEFPQRRIPEPADGVVVIQRPPRSSAPSAFQL